MAGGFKSPLLPLGLSSEAVEVQGGFKTPIPFIGIGAITTVVSGFYTPLPFFSPSGSESIITDPIGFGDGFIGSGWFNECPEEVYSLGWFGCDTEVIPTPEKGVTGALSYDRDYDRKQKKTDIFKQARQEDEEILLLLQAIISHKNIL